MRKRLLAVASGGGHWEQLAIISQSFDKFDVLYATTLPGLPEKSGLAPSVLVTDANRDRPLQMLLCARDIAGVILKFRPNIIISTGAAPGFIGLLFGKMLGAKVIWVDSVANSEQLSLSGKLASRFADRVLTQWQHLAGQSKSQYMGGVL